MALYSLPDMLIPELLQLKQQVQRSFNMGNNIRQYSGLPTESSNEFITFITQIQAEIDSRQVNNNT